MEDYSYPEADQVKAERGIDLISGDGRITLAECGATENQIQVESYRNLDEPRYCFDVRGNSGQLSLTIPNVYFIWAGDAAVRARITVAGETLPTVSVPAGDGKPVGAEDPANHAVLLELRAG